MRDDIIESLNPLLADLIKKASAGRFQGKEETHRLRIAYINSLSNLLRAYNQLLRDTEIEELKEEIEKLKEKYEDSIIWIDGIRFPPSVKLRNYSLRLNPRVKRNFDKLRGERTVNNFLKRLMECYEENNIKR